MPLSAAPPPSAPPHFHHQVASTLFTRLQSQNKRASHRVPFGSASFHGFLRVSLRRSEEAFCAQGVTHAQRFTPSRFRPRVTASRRSFWACVSSGAFLVLFSPSSTCLTATPVPRKAASRTQRLFALLLQTVSLCPPPHSPSPRSI